MESTVPESTRPGRERQAGRVGCAVEGSAVEAGIKVGRGVEVGGFDVEVSAGRSDGEQAVMQASKASRARSVKNVVVHFVARRVFILRIILIPL